MLNRLPNLGNDDDIFMPFTFIWARRCKMRAKLPRPFAVVDPLFSPERNMISDEK